MALGDLVLASGCSPVAPGDMTGIQLFLSIQSLALPFKHHQLFSVMHSATFLSIMSHPFQTARRHSDLPHQKLSVHELNPSESVFVPLMMRLLLFLRNKTTRIESGMTRFARSGSPTLSLALILDRFLLLEEKRKHRTQCQVHKQSQQSESISVTNRKIFNSSHDQNVDGHFPRVHQLGKKALQGIFFDHVFTRGECVCGVGGNGGQES